MDRDTAREIVKSWIDEALQYHTEPSRAGVRKGDLIGFSYLKKKTSMLMIIYGPFSLKEIASISGITANVLSVWRTEDEFKKKEIEVCDLFAEVIINTIYDKPSRLKLRKITIGKKETRGYEKANILIQLLPFLNSRIVKTVSDYILKMAIENQDSNSIVFHLDYLLYEHLAKRGTIEKWVLKPEILEIRKALLAGTMIYVLTGKDQHLREKYAKRILDSYFNLIDILAKKNRRF